MSRIVRPDAVSFARNGEEARPGGNRPRLGDTDPSRLWFSRGQQQMLDRLRADVLAGTGVLFLTGDVGTGKTFLARALVHRLRADAIIATPMYTRDDPQDFWREVGVEWGIEGAPDTLEDLYDGLTTLLDGAAGGNKRVLLFVDEAQSLSRDLLAEIGRLAVMAGEPRSPARLSILLVGQDGLGTVLSRSENAELAKRVGARYVTEPLTEAEVREYVAHQLSRDGRERAVFTDDGLRELVIASQGIPRLINSIVDLALLTQLAGGNGGYRCRSGSGMRAPTRRRSFHAPAGHSDHPDGAPAPGPLGLALHSGPRSADRPLGVRLRDGLAARSHAGGEHERSACRGARAGALPAAAGRRRRPRLPGPASPDALPPPRPDHLMVPSSVRSTRRRLLGRAGAAGASEPGPSAAVAPGPPVGFRPPSGRPAADRSAGPRPRASEPKPSVAAVPGPPVGSVQPAPVPPAPVRPLPRPAAEGTTARSESPADAAPAARTQVVTAPTSSGARRPPEVQAAEESDPGGIIDWLLSEYPARRQ